MTLTEIYILNLIMLKVVIKRNRCVAVAAHTSRSTGAAIGISGERANSCTQDSCRTWSSASGYHQKDENYETLHITDSGLAADFIERDCYPRK